MACRDYLYRGRHRQGRSPGRTAGILGTAAAAGIALALPGTASAADDGILDSIAQCESGGDTSASNGSHFGVYQFDLATWRSVGGTGHPLNASASEQRAAAQRLLAARGTQPWNASRSCWGGRHAARHVVSTPSAHPRHVPTARPHRAHRVDTTGSRVPDGYRVRRGDTLGRLAHRYHTSVREIAHANHIHDVGRIYVGQRLV